MRPIKPPELHYIPSCVVDLIPESVARESRVLAISESLDVLVVAVSDPVDQETVEKLRFILNRQVLALPVADNWLDQHIAWYYGKPDAALDD